MVKKQYLKSTGRLFTKHIIRLLSIAAIFIVSIGLMSGLGVVKYNVKQYVNDVYNTCNVHDLDVYNFDHSSMTGKVNLLYKALSNEEAKQKYNIKDISLSYSYDCPDISDESNRFAYRVISGDFSNLDNYSIDKLVLVGEESKLPKDNNQVLVNEATNEIKKHAIGDKIKISLYGRTKEVEICGIVRNPTLLAKAKEPSAYFLGDKYQYLNDVIYYNDSKIATEHPERASNLKITFNSNIRNLFNDLSDPYKKEIAVASARIQDFFAASAPEVTPIITSLEQCFSYNSLIKYADKVSVIAYIFIAFFSFITLLVVFSTMTRLFDEDRGSMAVLKTLGYSNFAISMRYVVFVLIAGLIGAFGSLLPSVIVNNMIIKGFMMQYNLWSIKVPVITAVFAFCSSIVLLLSIILTVISSLKAAAKKPVELLTPKAPKVGKKILLERVKKLWNKLSFKYKSTCRNVFLFKGRFLMTFFSIIASTVIVFASLALFDNSINNNTVAMDTSALKIISLVLLGFSAVLCALVVYNITNINISERRREIATLMVLGYRNPEVKGYIYREIYIMSALSALVGLPAGVGFVYFVFKLMDFGELRFINWWTYIITPIVTFLFAILATLLLNRKITKTDMNDSLKVLE